jgi:hypothetical protein
MYSAQLERFNRLERLELDERSVASLDVFNTAGTF